MIDGNVRPISTYRLQFNRDFRFEDAQRLVPYFSRLGISHVYASPILRARKSSTHGYDVVDPKTINPHLGDKHDLISLVTDLRHFGLGLVLDIVPNHMAASIENPYWRDVLTYGRSSPFAGWFDINWRLPDPEMWGRVLAPVLGEPRKKIIEQDQIGVVWSDGRFLIKYFDNFFPIDPATVPSICAVGIDSLMQIVEEGHYARVKIQEVLTELKKLPKLAARQRRNVAYDRNHVEQLLGDLAQAIVHSPRIEQWAEETATEFSHGPDGRRRLRMLLDKQPYRLVYWRDAARTINYRRFFDINELISIRQEDPQVFDETHEAILRWVHDGLLDGLRIDHIDGLRDPVGYLLRLNEAVADGNRTRRSYPIFIEKILGHDERLPHDWPVAGTTGYEFLNQVEASLISPPGFETIERRYRQMVNARGNFADVAEWGKRRVLRNDLSAPVNPLADALVRIAELHREHSPAAEAGDEVAAVTRSASVHDLADPSSAVAGHEQQPEGSPAEPSPPYAHPSPTKRDFVDAIVEFATALPVYRTYVDSRRDHVNDAERQMIETALDRARRSGRASPEAVDVLGRVLLLDDFAVLPDHLRNAELSFIQRLQQLTGPAAAKGIEDTALYAYVPLASLNEVGGEPHLSAEPVAELHRANVERAEYWPRTMLCATTHDTKRTADVRARLDVLSEVPDRWLAGVNRWRKLSREFRRRIDDRLAPDDLTEYVFFQTLVGLWPAAAGSQQTSLPSLEVLDELTERIKGYMLKAAREAKMRTTWTVQNRDYEQSIDEYIERMLAGVESASQTFLGEICEFVAGIARPGFWNSLARTLMQYTSPGTPDLYQGDELWNFALVDPDNRRPVDYEARQRLLDEVIIGIESPREARAAFVQELVDNPEDGRIKLHLIHSALVARREHPLLFSNGNYVPLEADGRGKDHVIAFARIVPASAIATGEASADDSVERPTPAAIVIVPRLTTGIVARPENAPLGPEVWGDTCVRLPTELAGFNGRCLMTGELIAATEPGILTVADVLKSFPAALLIGEP